MADSKTLRAGAATSNISPALGASINGGMQDQTAEFIHDELHARAIVLDDGDTRLAIVVCDSCMIPRELLDQAKHLAHSHTGIPLERMLISATHTHSAPAVAGVFQTEPNPEYAKFLVTRVADCIRQAAHNLAPAKIGWGSGSVPGAVFNRRWKMKAGTPLVDPFGLPDRVKMNPPPGSPDLDEPSGPIDQELGVLAIVAADGRPIALFANYALHYVGGVGPGHISADYFGAFADRVRQLLDAERLDPPFVGILSNGASGNINNIDFREKQQLRSPYAQIQKVADLVAAEALRVFKSIEPTSQATLAMREARLRLARRPTPKVEVARAKFILSQARGPKLQTLEEIYARETVLLDERPMEIETSVQALRIGELGIATSPCETFVETGLAVKAGSPLKPTWIIELANDYAGYLPTAEHHALGGYETWRARSSFLDVDAEEKLRAKMLDLLAAVAKR